MATQDRLNAFLDGPSDGPSQLPATEFLLVAQALRPIVRDVVAELTRLQVPMSGLPDAEGRATGWAIAPDTWLTRLAAVLTDGGGRRVNHGPASHFLAEQLLTSKHDDLTARQILDAGLQREAVLLTTRWLLFAERTS